VSIKSTQNNKIMQQAQNRHSQKVGYYEPKTALWGHIIYFHKKVKDSAELIEKYGKYGMRGFSRSLPDDHTLLKIKDKSQPFTKKQTEDLPQLRYSRISEILTKALTNLYAKYLKRSDVAFIDLVKMVDRTNISGDEPIIARLYLNTYQIMDSKYLEEKYWYLRKPLWAYYGGGVNSKKVVYSVDIEDNEAKNIVTTVVKATMQVDNSQFVSEVAEQKSLSFSQMMAQVQTINADFHTFLCDCGFSFNHYERNDLFVNIKNELFVQVIDNHSFANDLLTIIRNVFGSACKLHYRLAKNTSTTQAKPETTLQPPKTFNLGADKRTGSTNIGSLTSHIPQTPKVYAEPQPTAQQKLKAAISKLAKFNNNYAVYLHNTLNYSKIEQETLFCMVTNQQAKEKVEKERDFADLCQYLKQAFEVQEVVLEVYTRKQSSYETN
jgi:hypothetical protein